MKYYYHPDMPELQQQPQQPATEQPVAQQPVVQQPVAYQPVAQQPVAQQPVAYQPVAQQPVVQQPVAYQPVGAPQGAAAWYLPQTNSWDYERQQKQQKEKREIRKAANGIGAGLLFVEGIGMVLGVILPIILGLIFTANVNTESVYYNAIVYVIYSPISILVSMWLGLKIAGGSFKKVVPFEKTDGFLWLCCILCSFLYIFIGNIVADVFAMVSPHTVENLSSAMGGDPQTPMELVISILYTAAIPALVEELAFRGIVLGVLRKYGDCFAIVASSVLFGLLHGNFIQIPFAFFVGLIVAYTVVRTGNIVPAIIIHFINNAMSALISYFTTGLSDSMLVVTTILLYGSWLFLGLLGFCLLRFCFKEKPKDCFTPYKGCLTPKARSGAFYSGAVLVIAMLVYGFSAFVFALPLNSLLSGL